MNIMKSKRGSFFLCVMACLCLLPGITVAQGLRVEGTVIDELNGPLTGATVHVEGSNMADITDNAGHYVLPDVPRGSTLVFSFLGYHTHRVTVSGPVMDVTMISEDQQLEEVVVIGYGTQRRSLLSNAVSSMKFDESNTPVNSLSPTQMLQGRIAGVNTATSSGNLGSREKVSIRGASSLSASNEPLYVVDGIPIMNSNGNLYDFGESMSTLSTLNLTDIESMEVLKDAASAAIYGSRATNGVILITTKSGREGKTETKINLNAGFSNFAYPNKVRYADSRLYIEQYNEGASNYNRQYGLKVGDSGYILPVSNPHPGVPDVNWLKLILRQGRFFSTDASFSGGTAKSNYYVSLGFDDQKGIVKTNAIQKITFNAKLNQQMTSWLKVGTNVIGTYLRNNQVPGPNSGATILARATQKRPFDLPYKPNGEYYVGGTDDLAYHNPLQILNEQISKLDNYRFLGNLYADIKFIEQLTFRTTLNADVGYTYDYLYYNANHPYGLGTGRLLDNKRFTTNLTLDNVLTYADKAGDFEYSAMVGHSFQKMASNSSMIDGNGFPSSSFDVIGVAAVIANTNGTLSEFAMESYFSRASLSYKEKYILNATFRADGSSKFAPDVRWGYFPSVSLGWNLSKEEFFDSPGTDLKFRISYGKTGNQEGIGNYASLPLMSGGLNYGYDVGIGVTGFGNDRLTWEMADQYNAGLDLSLFSGRLNFIVDAYQKNTNNLLYNKPTPATTGETSNTVNIGSMRNRGIEFTITSNLNLGKVFWSSQFNIAFNENKLTSLLGEDLIAIGANRALKVGSGLGVFYLYKMEGIYQYDGEVPQPQYDQGVRAGDVKWRDVDKNGLINDSDRVLMGSSNPKFAGGWNNTFRYRNFQLDVFFNYMYGNNTYSEWKQTSLARIGYLAGVLEDEAANRWTGPGSTNIHPRSINGAARSGYNTMNSDRFLEDGSFLRLQMAQISYQFPQSILKHLGLASLRVYCQGNNLFLITPYSGYDPEVSNNLDPSKYGVDLFSMPAPRSVSFGLNMSF